MPLQLVLHKQLVPGLAAHGVSDSRAVNDEAKVRTNPASETKDFLQRHHTTFGRNIMTMLQCMFMYTWMVWYCNGIHISVIKPQNEDMELHSPRFNMSEPVRKAVLMSPHEEWPDLKTEIFSLLKRLSADLEMAPRRRVFQGQCVRCRITIYL